LDGMEVEEERYRLYYVETASGQVKIIAEVSRGEAILATFMDCDPAVDPEEIREATEDDIAWVRANGGTIPVVH